MHVLPHHALRIVTVLKAYRLPLLTTVQITNHSLPQSILLAACR